jgi:hypothetical protein
MHVQIAQHYLLSNLYMYFISILHHLNYENVLGKNKFKKCRAREREHK